jgi:hypothetical protein
MRGLKHKVALKDKMPGLRLKAGGKGKVEIKHKHLITEDLDVGCLPDMTVRRNSEEGKGAIAL